LGRPALGDRLLLEARIAALPREHPGMSAYAIAKAVGAT